MARGAEHTRALSFCCCSDPSARSGNGELVTAAFAASEPKLDVGAMFQVTGKGNGTAMFSPAGKGGSCAVEQIDYR